MASLFKVKARYDFEAKEEDDLGFPVGQIIDVTEEVDDSWLEGKYTDPSGAIQAGIFPREFVEKYEPPMPARPTRPARTKPEAAPAPEPVAEPEEPESEEVVAPPVAVASKPKPPPRETEEVRSPTSAAQPAPPMKSEPLPAPKPVPAETASAKKPPPPIAAKSNAFRDRIAAFNQPAAAPVAPIIPGGGKPQGNTFIKKPFVAPPPSANSYVPPPKVETVHKPYIREEDPEIKRRREEDHAAAEAAGLTRDPEQQEEGEDVPKPTTLKERIALLQQQQLEQAQRRADGGAEKREKKPPVKKFSQSSEQAEAVGEADELEQVTSRGPVVAGRQSMDRQSLDLPRERPRVPSTQLDETPLSPVIAAPEHEPVSENDADQSAAGETTEDDAGTIGPDDSDERHAPLPPSRANTAPKQQADVGDEQDPEEGEEEEDDSMDEDTRRRLELRDRMAKMSGGMGMAGMFGPPGAMPLPGGAASKKKSTKPRQASAENETTSPPPPPQRVPMPGFSRKESSEAGRKSMERSERGLEEDQPMPPPRKSLTEERAAAPPVPKGSRPSLDASVPPPVPGSGLPTPRATAPDARPVPPPPATSMSPGPGYQSDDEMSINPQRESIESPDVLTPGPPTRASTGMAPPVPGSATDNKSYFNSEPQSATSDRRASRAPPPVPESPLTSPRPPPPPPPANAARSAVPAYTDDSEGRGESEYEGDYDTDIASGVKHKDALKSQHVRDISLDDSTTAENSPVQPPLPPQANAPRAVPPRPPQLPTRTRQSTDLPRAPPPLPPGSQQSSADQDDDYDPFRYENRRGPPPPAPVAVPVAAPSLPPPVPNRETDEGQDSSADELYSTTPPRRSVERPPPPPPQERAVPAPPPAQAPPSQPAPPPQRAAPRESLDIRRSDTTGRRSMESRPAEGNGQIAADVPLPSDTQWWTASQPLPPALQSRNGVDILSECEESTTSKRGGITYISKDIYVLYMDYSQTIITARFDSKNPADINLEQRHLPPPPKLRQDQLEGYWQRFGRAIAESASSLGNTRKDSTVGDGTPFVLVSTLIAAHPKALQPVGTRAYGSIIYANLANASTLQYDEIRAGDIVTLRNARFEGTHGAMKHKYKADYGPQHVAIVEEWDGTKRAIKGWEQGRDGKKGGVRSEKFRLGDLKSGEVRVWRVVGRDWVEWETEN
ncbi:SH3-domain-containing protein [Zymoseptoria brevis]|uniref:SH3-domain-containing protein n=1 Tax=Zymoseptoria brevis TaxID=1047168 RepID=A0A0F4G4G7_9PEZI|nr:SH3-domain-containing protein [Zymoseptoria brevis]